MIARILRKRRARKSQEYLIGRHRITLPVGHQLAVYQNRWQCYDRALGRIASSVLDKYPDAAAIDIGANIGDTAALICSQRDMPVLCIEGNPEFLPLLEKNVARISDLIEIEACFVSDRRESFSTRQIDTNCGTASIVNANVDESCSDTIPAKTLDEIITTHTLFQTARLLKIDTDGFDFQIIGSSLDFLARTKAVLFFEYALDFQKSAVVDSLKAIDNLFQAGYRCHLVYDNFGQFLISVDNPARFREINAYLTSNRMFGPAIHYVDVCSFHDDEIDLFEVIRNSELALVEKVA